MAHNWTSSHIIRIRIFHVTPTHITNTIISSLLPVWNFHLIIFILLMIQNRAISCMTKGWRCQQLRQLLYYIVSEEGNQTDSVLESSYKQLFGNLRFRVNILWS